MSSNTVGSKVLETILLIGGVALLSSAAQYPEALSQKSSSVTYIHDCQELQGIQDDPMGSYVLANDIACESVPVFTIIPNFYGSLDGDDSTISNVNIVNYNGPAGIFGELHDASVSNLNLENIRVYNTTSIHGSDLSHDTGSLSGRVKGNTHIENVNVKNVHVRYKTSTHHNGAVGGLIGRLQGSEDKNVILSNIQLDQGNVIASDRVGEVAGSAHHAHILDVSSDINVSGSSDLSSTHFNGLIGEASFVHLASSASNEGQD